MNIPLNSNFILRQAVNQKWPLDTQKEWWYIKLAEVRRAKLLRCSEQQNHRCCYCGTHTWHANFGEVGSKRKMATLEHIRTRREGGTDSMNNLAMACSRCNNSRGDLYDAIEFYEIVVGIREGRKAKHTVEDLEALREKKLATERRVNQRIFETAWTLQVMNLWGWWDSWFEFATFALVDKAA